MNITEAAALMAHRRSVKPANMDGEKEISDGMWQTLIECANWAPSHGHTEPWRFTIFRGGSRKLVAEALQAAYKAETPEAEFKQQKHDNMGVYPLQVHAVIAIVMNRGDLPKVPVIEEVEAVACAVQNMHLAASAAGLGMYWSSPAATYGASFTEFLKLGDEDKCLGLLYVGWPKEGQEWPKSTRKPAMDKVVWK
ncbi:MAG: nitroreductase family protein [Akkermansiaceae bacterium]